MADLTVGKKAPLFTLPSDGGQDISLSDYKGGKVILYFYPKDNTSGARWKRRHSALIWKNLRSGVIPYLA